MVRMWLCVVGLALVGALFVDAAALRRTRQAAGERVRDGRSFSMTKKHSRALTEGKRSRFFGNEVHRDAQRGANGLELSAEVAWTFNASWDGGITYINSMQPSELDSVIYAYAGRDPWNTNSNNSYLFALDGVNGHLL
jgi:hypothetical protein